MEFVSFRLRDERGRLRVLKFKKIVNEKWKSITAIILSSISIVFVLRDVTTSFSVPSFYSPYIVILPLAIVGVLKLFCLQKKCIIAVNRISPVVWVATIEYLGLLLFVKKEFPLEVKIFMYMITMLYLFIYIRSEESKDKKVVETGNQQDEKKIFSLYYINTDKVYEIAMLLNNKIITGGTSENELESSIERQTSLGISTNLSYLETVKGELGASQNTQVHNSIKNKVLENFDVKTTKSNMLASIIAKAITYEEGKKVDLGDLVLLKNASLKLLNAEESYAITKMILNGAFKDTKISSNSDDMKIEFDLSAMINSLLKDCAYELGCEVNDKKFLLTIPMTFENDFENSYNIYDLQVGTVTVVGIYRGMRQYKKRMSLQEIFSDNNENKMERTYEDEGYQLISSTREQKEEMDYIADKNSELDYYQEVIDVIAVIQEINAK